MLETQSEEDLADGELLATKAKFGRRSHRRRGRETKQRLRESKAEMADVTDEAEDIEKKQRIS